MNEQVTIRPVSRREHVAANTHGCSDWSVIRRDQPLCFDRQDAVLIEKNGHVRWMLMTQVK